MGAGATEVRPEAGAASGSEEPKDELDDCAKSAEETETKATIVTNFVYLTGRNPSLINRLGVFELKPPVIGLLRALL